MRLLNGNATERSRSSDGTRVLDCGCAHTDVMWLQMCDAHAAETDALHAQAQGDHTCSILHSL